MSESKRKRSENSGTTNSSSGADFFPKENLIDLHFHLDGSISPKIAKILAKNQGIDIPENDEELKKMLTVTKDCKDLKEFLQKFELPTALLQTKESISEAVRLVKEEAKNEGVIYLEIRFAPQLSCFKGLTQEEVIQAALDGMKKSDLHSNLILCLMRGPKSDLSLSAANKETLSLAKKFLVPDGGVVAIDLAGDEKGFPNDGFAEFFAEAKQKGIPFTIHSGEADGAESVRKAVELGATRIGHGVRACEDEKLMQILSEKKIVLEIAPTSNELTNAIVDRDYPIRTFLDKGIKITLNTDDKAICQTTLKEEYKNMIEEFKLTEKEVLDIMLTSVEAAFTTDEIKRKLKDKILEEHKIAQINRKVSVDGLKKSWDFEAISDNNDELYV